MKGILFEFGPTARCTKATGRTTMPIESEDLFTEAVMYTRETGSMIRPNCTISVHIKIELLIFNFIL